ncbi:uncharacterized protein LOC123558279 [Mercenaria mercenaria]|uniref:uncharacterized protein LOC123558279 n=1 Tax=Mercenaria mercenaria TaxID=6596 RepID=UPI00234EFA79|nr:uncharacterized protein LOC123558279 [Mercenaria mercenaria]
MDPKSATMIDMLGGYGGLKPRNERSFNLVYHFIQMCTYTPLRFFDWGTSNIFRLELYVYWFIVGRYPKFLEKRIEFRHSEKIAKKEKEIEHLKKEKEKLKKEKGTIEDEKQDALRRLSEVISVRLRDNNPNIVDLNDQCRPTKLAEMFSELYDNEWTSAFAVLEGPVGDKSAIKILLDTVMQAYEFCEEKVAVPWNIVTSWFLDMNLPGAQQTSKWLKDSRKTNIRNKVPEVANEFEKETLYRFQENKVAELIEVKHYRTKCIELCLLMVTTDPPVVPLYPGWSARLKNQEHSNISQSLAEKAVDNNDEEKEKDEQELLKDEAEPKKSLKEEGERFDKDLYKEYTVRGQYLDYIVWPALFLYQDGPILSKGIAQGSVNQSREPEKE